MPRNPRADQIGTGGRIKSESPGGCARNAQLDDWLRANQITYKKKRLTPVNRSGLMCGPNAAVGENARIG